VIARAWQWLNHRLPVSAIILLGLKEDMPGGTSFAYTIGSATLLVFLVQVVTGVWQMFYYVPTVDHAYDSLNYLRQDVPFGWLVHGLHYWGATAMVILVGLHMMRVFIWGAYKRPREVTWLLGVILLLLTAGLSFTGAPLPWDERGYWAAEVGTSIAGTVPIIGSAIRRLLRGGETMGQLTLSRFFVQHVAILPAILLMVVMLHLIALRRFGSAGAWKPVRHRQGSQFWPDQAVKDALVGALVLLALIALATYAPPPLSGPADPTDTSYTPKPEWNFLFLYQALKFFPGRLEAIGTVGIPTVIVVLLVVLPFLDRGEERRPARRPIAMACGLTGVAGVLALTAAGYFGKPGGTQTAAAPPVASVASLSPSARQGAALVHSLGCTGCHRIHGTGGTAGPDLSNEALRNRSRDWLATQIRAPKTHNPHSTMPPFSTLSTEQVNDLVDYLLSLDASGTPPSTSAATTGNPPPPPPAVAPSSGASHPARAASAPVSKGPPGPAAAIIGNARHGATLFKRNCASCHGPAGTGQRPNPGSDSGTVPPLNPVSRRLFNSDPQIFADNIDRFIQQGTTPAGPHPALTMPDFGASRTLTQQEIADIEAYVLQVNGVNRAQLRHPGLAPHRFFFLTLVAFGLTGLGLGGLWMRLRKRRSDTRPS
jgi:ubiquinol-cytochrome c reductase cytochrome b subunit